MNMNFLNAGNDGIRGMTAKYQWWNPDESYQNKCGEYVDAYVQGIKEAGNLWGIPVIDFNSVTGMNPMIEEQLIYFYDSGYDRLHPNTNGQERMAHTLMYQLLSLPASF